MFAVGMVVTVKDGPSTGRQAVVQLNELNVRQTTTVWSVCADGNISFVSILTPSMDTQLCHDLIIVKTY